MTHQRPDRYRIAAIQFEPILGARAENIARLLELSAACVKERMTAKHQLMSLVVESALPPLMVDGRRLKQALINLLSNASQYTQEGGFTPLLFAARVGDIESATRLLAAGANIEDTAPTGTSALVLAAHSDQGVFAKFLLEKGANPNADGAGYAALHAAIVRGNLDLLKALLAHRANPNIRQRKGSPSKRYSGFALDKTMMGATPFLLATRASQPEMMKALAAAGGDVNLTLDDGTTPIMAAARRQGREGRGLSEDRVVQAIKLARELGTRSELLD